MWAVPRSGAEPGEWSQAILPKTQENRTMRKIYFLLLAVCLLWTPRLVRILLVATQ